MSRSRLAAACACAALLLLPAAARGATFTVTTGADADNPACTPTECTLRDAIAAANLDPDPTVEVALPAGTYDVSLGELLITNDMTIRGAGAGATIVDAGGTSRVFEAETAGTVTFQDMTITGGAAGPGSSGPAGDGGAILNQADGVALRRLALVGNTATFSGGAYAAPFEGSTGQVTTIEDSLIAGNTVTGGVLNGQGGGLSLFGDATITNSTISGNTVANVGINQGGGVVAATASTDPTPATLTLLNTTIAGNSIAGVLPGGVTPNVGGGLAGSSLGPTPVLTDLRSKNTLIANNRVDGATQDCGLVTASETSRNLSSDATCGFTDPGSLQSADPRLGALAANGGPTETMALLDGSPAINAGDNAGCPGTDQRGTARPQGPLCDIGAYERVIATDLSVTQSAKRKVKAGRKLTYSITVRNRGPLTAPNVRLSDRFPVKALKVKGQRAGCAFAKKAKKKGKRKVKRRKPPKRALSCAFGSLAPGAERTIKVKLRPRKAGKRLRNTAAVTSDIADADRANDSATTVVRVTRPKGKRKR